MIGIGVDVRTVVYQGARLVLDGARLPRGVRMFGSRFVLTADDACVARFGFDDAERAVVDALRAGTSPPEIEARQRELDPRMIEAVIYALASCGAVSAQVVGGTRPRPLAASEVRGLSTAGREMLARSVDHFTMLGLPIGASVEAVRTAYLELARNLRLERLTELRIRDRELDARALLAQITIAFTVLTDPARRAEYIAALRRSGVRGSEAVDIRKLAAEASQRGKRAIRADAGVASRTARRPRATWCCHCSRHSSLRTWPRGCRRRRQRHRRAGRRAGSRRARTTSRARCP